MSTQQLSQVTSYPHSALAYPTSFVPQPHNFASTSVQPPPNAVTLEDLKEILTFNRKDRLPPWNLRKYGGCPLQWFEWIGQFRSAVDSQNLSDDVKLHYLKSLVKDKAETAIAEFAYSGTMYKDALMTLERKFGQPQIIIRAYLDKLYNSPPVKMHSSDSIISFASIIASIVGVFKSLHYNAGLESATLLDKAIEKLPPNMKESWSFHTVKRSLYAPSLIDFNHWLEDKTEAHERMRPSSNYNRNQDNSVRTKTNVKTFAANSQAKFDANIQYSPCLVCKSKPSIFKCSVFKEKTPTQLAKFCAENKLCFSCFQGNHMFRKCPKPKTCPKPQCKSTHNVLLHGAERVFPTNNHSGYAPHTTAANPAVQTPFRPTTQNNTCGTSLMNLKGLMPLINLTLSSNDSETTALVLCDTACSHSCISPELARRLNLKGRKIDLAVKGANCSEDITSEQVDLNVSSKFDPDISFTVCAYVKNNIYIGSDIINVRRLKEKYFHLEPIHSVEFRSLMSK